jgi:transglutaminase/protease-like cytokinesis protein 3
MKWLLIVCCWVIASPVLSQPRKTDFFQVDQHALSTEASTTEELSKKLTAGYTTDLEKTRAIFRWITENIAYRMRPSPGKKAQDLFMADDKDTGALKPLDERVADAVLKNKQALCDGYARLFKTLCEFSGVRSEVIYGYARTETFKRIQRFRSNHTWNAVHIDSTWYLLDVTWASGYIDNRSGQFIRDLDEQYFLTTPAIFIREHYPDDLSWTLMQDPPLMPEFRYSPFRQRAFIKYKIEQYSPATGMIEAKIGDTLQFQLFTTDRKADENISANPFLDQSLYSSSQSALIKPLSSKGNLIQYNYTVISSSVQWIYLLYNEDLILRYRIRIKVPGAISVLAAMD